MLSILNRILWSIRTLFFLSIILNLFSLKGAPRDLVRMVWEASGE